MYSRHFSVGYDFSKSPTASNVELVCTDDIKDPNLLRVKSTNVVGDYVIKAKLLGEATFEPIFVGTGTVDTTLDISLYDRIIVCSTNALTDGTLAISSFVTYGDVTNNVPAGTATAANQVVANDLLTQILQDVQDDVDCAESPTVTNLDITVANSIFDIVLPLDTKKFMIRHRDRGNIELAFESTLSAYFTVPKGNTYSESGLCLVSTTIYVRSDKVGTIEIITWT